LEHQAVVALQFHARVEFRSLSLLSKSQSHLAFAADARSNRNRRICIGTSRAVMRQRLINAAAGHYVAAEKKAHEQT
jgi:hypothetical protein